MTVTNEIRLLGFAGYPASEHFLRALDDEIWIARHDPDSGRSAIRGHRPQGIDNGDALRAELEQPSLCTVVSAQGAGTASPLSAPSSENSATPSRGTSAPKQPGG